MADTPKLTVIETGTDKAKANVVEYLEDALAQAKDGKIIAIGLAVVRPGGGINVGHTGTDRSALGSLLGAATLMAHRIVSRIEFEGE